MNLRYYGAIGSLLLGLWSCGSQTSEEGAPDVGPLTIDPTIGYCYQTSLPEIMEHLELEVTGDQIKGQGARVEQGTQKVYELTFEGTLSGNEAEVTIYGTNANEEKDRLTHRERWVFDETHLYIQGRDVRAFQGNYTLHRVACEWQANADTTLYNFHGSFQEGYALVGKAGNYGLVNEEGEEVLPLAYKDLTPPSEGLLSFYDVNTALRGLINIQGEVLVPPKYGEITGFSEGLAAFLDNETGLWGFMNPDLEIVIAPQYYGVNFFQSDPYRKVFTEGLAKVQDENNLWRFINPQGAVVIAGDFIYADPFQNGEARVFKNNKWYYINKAGQCVKNCDE